MVVRRGGNVVRSFVVDGSWVLVAHRHSLGRSSKKTLIEGPGAFALAGNN